MITERFSSADGTSLVADRYEPTVGQGGLLAAPFLLIVHGYCEHRGRYRATAEFFASHGYEVLTFDLRGHGQSGGRRAHVQRFGEYVADVSAAVDHVRRTRDQSQHPSRHQSQPKMQPTGSGAAAEQPILVGHSLGGLIALRFALDFPEKLRALVLSSPFLGLKLRVPLWKRWLGQLASLLYPQLALPSELDPGDLSHDPAVGQAYAQDPLVSRLATARWFTEAQAAQADVLRRAPTLRVPTLLLHAGDDRIADAAASQAVFDRFPHNQPGGPKPEPHQNQDQTPTTMMTVYPGLYHELFNEVERDRDRVRQDILTWLHGESTRRSL